MTRGLLWQRFVEEGLVEGELPALPEPRSPWPVRVMLGFAGWLASFFLLGFAGMVFHDLFVKGGAALPVGLVCCAAAFVIFHEAPRNDFLGQVGLAVSLAGQALVLVGLMNIVGVPNYGAALLLMAAIEAGLALAIPNYVHRVFTMLVANFCLLIGLASIGIPALATAVAAVGAALIWRDQIRMADRPSLWEPIGYGFAISLLHIDGTLMTGVDFWGRARHVEPVVMWIGPVAVGAVFVFVAWELGVRAGSQTNSASGMLATGAAVVVAVMGVFAPGISAALLVMLLGFANGKRVLIGLGMLAFACYLSHFYYELSATLLMKSIVLTGTGVALLALRWITGRVASHA